MALIAFILLATALIAFYFRRSFGSVVVGLLMGIGVALVVVPYIGHDVLGYAKPPCWDSVPGWHKLIALPC